MQSSFKHRLVLPLNLRLSRKGLRTVASNMQFTVGPPPYDSDTVITDGVICYKCEAFWTTSWMRLYMHLCHASPRTSVSCCLVLTSSTRPGGRSARLSPRRGSARCRYEPARLSAGPPFWPQPSLPSRLCCEKVVAFDVSNADVVNVNGCESHEETLFLNTQPHAPFDCASDEFASDVRGCCIPFFRR